MASARHGRTVRRVLGVAAAFGCLSVPGAASAATLGPEDVAPPTSGGTYTCLSALTCTMANVQLPATVGGKETAPFTGKITKWRVNIPIAHDSYTNDGPLALQVLKRTAENVGDDEYDDEYAAVRESKYKDVTPDSVNSFNTNLRIRKGQLIGLAQTDNETEVLGGGDPGFIQWFEPVLVPGEPGAVASNTEESDYLLFNAKLVRD